MKKRRPFRLGIFIFILGIFTISSPGMLGVYATGTSAVPISGAPVSVNDGSSGTTTTGSSKNETTKKSSSKKNKTTTGTSKKDTSNKSTVSTVTGKAYMSHTEVYKALVESKQNGSVSKTVVKSLNLTASNGVVSPLTGDLIITESDIDEFCDIMLSSGQYSTSDVSRFRGNIVNAISKGFTAKVTVNNESGDVTSNTSTGTTTSNSTTTNNTSNTTNKDNDNKEGEKVSQNPQTAPDDIKHNTLYENSVKEYAQSVEGRNGSDPVIDLGIGSEIASAICEAANDYHTELTGDLNKVLIYEESDQTLSFSVGTYYKMSQRDKMSLMKDTLLSVNKSGLPSQIKKEMYDFIAERDTTTSGAVKVATVDYTGNIEAGKNAIKQSGLQKLWTKVSGLIVTFIIMAMSLGIILDLLYINIPYLCILMDNLQKKTKIGGCTPVAREVLKECSAGGYMGDGSNATLLYIKRKFMSIFFVLLGITLLLSGQLFQILGAIIGYAWYFIKIIITGGA